MGAIVSYLVAVVLHPEHIYSLFDITGAFTSREWTDLIVVISLFSHIVITGGFFCLTTLFYKGLKEDREKSVGRFFSNRNTPLVRDEDEHAHLDNRQRVLLGRMIAIAGILVIAMMAISNPLWGRLVFLICGSAVLSVGVILFSATTDVPEGHDTDRDDIDDGGDLSPNGRIRT